MVKLRVAGPDTCNGRLPMAASTDVPPREPTSPTDGGRLGLASLKKWFRGKAGTAASNDSAHAREPGQSRESSPGSPRLIRRVSRKVVPGLPRAQTFRRQQSENREKLELVRPSSAERRAVSVDRRQQLQRTTSHTGQPLPRASAPDFLDASYSPRASSGAVTAPSSPVDEKRFLAADDAASLNGHAVQDVFGQVPTYPDATSPADAQSITTSQYDTLIHDDLERRWILNLSMHFRDKSRREKFFVTYRENDFLWRRVTISLDYRDAPRDSLEEDLSVIKFQREKSAKIYEAIRESLQDIKFYPTVTNLKLQTTEGRLHVHVVEDVNEIIHFPTFRTVEHLNCRRVKERDIKFDSHMSGFVYKVRVGERLLIKKEIPGPDTVDEFLYEVNALSTLRFSRNIIEFFGVVVDDDDQVVKGLLISFAEQGALIDIIYDSQEQGMNLSWAMRERWARQIVQGLSDIHESGFVQGDFTLSNIVIDECDNAKIIDINRRGCPVGWEPPEATLLIDSNQRISMYIGVKSDLYQLGMVLWALATLEDEPEAHRRPLRLDKEIDVPLWYRSMVENCLHVNPRVRLQATALLDMFPEPSCDELGGRELPAISVDDGNSLQEYLVDGGNARPQIKTVEPRHEWSHATLSDDRATSPGLSDEPYYYPQRGRSPPRTPPDRHDMGDSSYAQNSVLFPSSNATPAARGASAGASMGDGATTATAEHMEQDLEEIEAGLRARLEREQAETGGDSQTTKEAIPDADGQRQTPRIADPHEQSTLLQRQTDPALAESFTHQIGEPEEAPSVEVIHPENRTAASPPGAERGNTEPAPPPPPPPQLEVGGSSARAASAITTETQAATDASLPPTEDGGGGGGGGGESSSDTGANYTHDRAGRNAATPPPPTGPAAADADADRRGAARGSPPELMGVGSAYDRPPQEYGRLSICSDDDDYDDDDLEGMPQATAARQQNVTSRA
ncbi:hypothetical protein GGR56DRAFT_672794 [Xylariaceae sp. FL0804]|nr:hypothetical protein GGR56DRAFT_672794 [Xylariaceae sp. FL0804]